MTLVRARMDRTFWTSGSGLAAALLMANPVFAQEADGEIVVTAQKREQRLQEVAGSISALGEDQLKEAGITSISDIATRLPGIDYGQAQGTSFVTLRGIGLAVDTGLEPNVALYVDGVFLPRTTMATLTPVDLQRVEVLRGPQGTLYGRNATGGAINFISKAPGSSFGGEVQAMYGNFQTVELRGAVTAPLSDRVRVRLSSSYRNQGKGYVDNVFLNRDQDKNEVASVRGALNADLTDALVLDMSLSYQWERFQTFNQLVRPLGPLAAVLFPDSATAVAPARPWTNGGEFIANSTRSTLLGRVQMIWEVSPDVSLKSITGYTDHKFENQFEADGTSAAFLTIRDRKEPSKAFSQELNLGGALPNAGSWLVGAIYYHEKAPGRYSVVLPNGIPGAAVPPATIINELGQRTTSLALFGDVTIGLSDRFRIYGGARLSRDTKKFEQTNGFIFPGSPPVTALSCDTVKSRREYDAFTPRVGAQVDLADKAMAYAQYSKGYKAGGINVGLCGDDFEPESLEAQEIGLKSAFLDGRGIFNLSLFHYRYKGLQILKATTNLTAITLENADARTYGAEIETSFRINDVFKIDASATWLDAKFTDYQSVDAGDPGAGVQDLRGETTPRTPKYSLNFGLEARFPVALAGFSTLTLRADTRYSGKLYFQPFNVEEYQQRAYALVQVNAILATPDNDLSVRAFVRNLTNKPVLAHAIYQNVEDAYVGNYLPPRTYGLEIMKAF